jgi:N-acetylneuraminic acid mutarotase
MLTRRAFAASAAALAACQNGQTEEANVPPPERHWRQAPDAPYAVQEIYPALHRGGLWIAGGFSPQARGATERVIVFDVARQSWSEGPALPTPSHHVHLASVNDELWAIGGFMGGASRVQWACTARVLKLDGDRWVEGPALPKPIGEAVPIVHLNRIHLIGGRSPLDQANSDWDDQGDVADHFVIAPDETSWTRAESLPLARNSAAGVSDGDRLHVISGRTVANGQTPRHDIYDPRTGRWSDGPAFPEPRGGLAAAFLDGAIVAGGGEIFDPGSVGTALYRFDGAVWSRFETLPVSRHGHGFLVADNALYALGGAERVSASGTMARVDVLS